ncbi:MAG: hypothetical protein ABEJ57_08155 [Halobacteriaceae archaeon]
MFARSRPWLAAALAFLYPGLGHVYLRAWIRAVSWFGLAILTVSVFILPEMSTAPSAGFSAFYAEFTSLPARTLFPLLIVNAFNVLDAYLVGRRSLETVGGGGDGAAACPNCGEELDEDLDFCPWCSTRLRDGEDEAAA